jgi:replication fork protection complex subunit Tof1/Swi1
MERQKIKEADTIRFLFLSRFFLEFFLLVHNDELAQGIDPSAEGGHDFDMIAEMTEPMSIGFVANRMKQALEDQPILWTDLHAGIDCYTQIVRSSSSLRAK